MEAPDTRPQRPAPAGSPRRSRRRLVVLALAAVAAFLVMRTVLDPFGGDEYIEQSHGNHVHFVPRDKDPEVSISSFPTERPGPDQRILPSGQVVPK